MNESDVIVPARQYAVNTRARLGQSQLRKMVKDIFNEGIHAKRVLSLANGVTGVLHASTLAVHAIGQAYAQVANIQGKSGVKQVDRMLSSNTLDLDKLLGLWVRQVVQGAKELVVIADWTHFDEDSHKTLYLQIATGHGRSVPLMWATYEKSELHNTQTDFEVIMIERLHELVAPDVHITLLGDRGFGNQRLYRLLQVYGWDFVIRFRGNILLKHGMEEGTTKSFMHKLPTMPDKWFIPLILAFDKILLEQQFYLEIFGKK